MINFNSQEGIALFLTLIIISVLLTVGLGLNSILVTQLGILRGMEKSMAVFYAAETGMEKVLYMDKLCRQPGCGVECRDTDDCDEGLSEGNITENIGLVTYSVDFDGGAYNIESTGYYKKIRRSVSVTR